LFKKGTVPHVNNVELDKRGRWRSNVWTYPGASSLGSDARRGLKHHPTVKPTAMLEDALLDLTSRGDIVVDPFLGSGSTLIAAEKTGRVCRGVALESEIRIKAISDGYDPTIGIMHEGSDGSSKFIFELMEPKRPCVDRAVLDFVKEHVFDPADFVIRTDGVCRLNPEMARMVVAKVTT
jgi:DNA methylase/CRISPR associated protein Cas1